MRRRDFLKNLGIITGAGTTSFLLGGIPIKAFAKPFLNINSTNGKILVLVRFNGGNDGLNTVIPFEDSLYYNKRPVIGIPKTNVIQLTNITGIHPKLQPFKELYDNGKASIIQNVGYPSPNRSHFRSTDIWLSASDSNQFIYDGWIGRYLLKSFPDFPNVRPEHPMAIQIGSVQSSLFDSTEGNLSLSFDNPDSFYTLVNGVYVDNDPPPSTIAGEELKFLKEIASLSVEYADIIKEKADVRTNLATYPNTNFANQLKIIADLIAGGLSTPVYLATLDGFDTHSSQLLQHEKLLGYFADAISAFQKDLQLLGVEDKVVVLTFSEFGRRVKENASAGTDHGTAAPMFLIGKNISGGIFGNNPDLANLDSNGDIKYVYDFRQIYASIMKDHFGMSNEQIKDILFKDFTTLPIIKSATDINSDYEIPTAFELKQNYPNPFNPSTTIEYAIPKASNVKIVVYDMIGNTVSTLINKFQEVGNYKIKFDGSKLASGTYLYSLETDNKKIAKKMVLMK